MLLSQLLGVKTASCMAQNTAAYEFFSTNVTKVQLLPEEVFLAPRTKDPKWIHHLDRAVHQQCQPISHNNNTRRADGLPSLLKHLLWMRLFCVPCISCMLDTRIHQQQPVSERHKDHFIIYIDGMKNKVGSWWDAEEIPAINSKPNRPLSKWPCFPVQIILWKSV